MKWIKDNSVLIGTLVASLSTLTIAIVSIFEINLTRDHIELIKEQIKISSEPNIIVSTVEDLESEPRIYVVTDSIKGDIFRFAYFIHNLGNEKAYKLKYHHDYTEDENYKIPPDSVLSTFVSSKIIMPYSQHSCGFDIIYKTELFDKLDSGIKKYCHFYMIFYDALGNKYEYLTSWVMEDYELETGALLIDNYRYEKINQK